MRGVSTASGLVTSEPASYLNNRTFTGQYRESAAAMGSLMHYGARQYSPYLGRMISADTIVPGASNPQALNRFSYVLNGPTNYTDPTGHMPNQCGNPDGEGARAGCDGHGQPGKRRYNLYVPGVGQSTGPLPVASASKDAVAAPASGSPADSEVVAYRSPTTTLFETGWWLVGFVPLTLSRWKGTGSVTIGPEQPLATLAIDRVQSHGFGLNLSSGQLTLPITHSEVGLTGIRTVTSYRTQLGVEGLVVHQATNLSLDVSVPIPGRADHFTGGLTVSHEATYDHTTTAGAVLIGGAIVGLDYVLPLLPALIPALRGSAPRN